MALDKKPPPAKKTGKGCSAMRCTHAKYKTGHCDVVECGNYWEDCDKHGLST